MKITPDEKTVLVALALSAPVGEAVAVAGLAVFFDRPVKLKRAVESLARWQLVTFDPFKREVRLLKANVLRALACGPDAVQPALFAQERPLDEPLAREQARGETVRRVNSPAARVNTHAVCANTHTHVHAHVPCNSSTSTDIHVHEVGELNGRTTAEILRDLRRLAPNLAAEHLDHWRARIEREDATAVNAVVRQCGLQRRSIKNPAGWMNSQYLKMVNGAGQQDA